MTDDGSVFFFSKGQEWRGLQWIRWELCVRVCVQDLHKMMLDSRVIQSPTPLWTYIIIIISQVSRVIDLNVCLVSLRVSLSVLRGRSSSFPQVKLTRRISPLLISVGCLRLASLQDIWVHLRGAGQRQRLNQVRACCSLQRARHGF